MGRKRKNYHKEIEQKFHAKERKEIINNGDKQHFLSMKRMRAFEELHDLITVYSVAIENSLPIVCEILDPLVNDKLKEIKIFPNL